MSASLPACYDDWLTDPDWGKSNRQLHTEMIAEGRAAAAYDAADDLAYTLLHADCLKLSVPDIEDVRKLRQRLDFEIEALYERLDALEEVLSPDSMEVPTWKS